MGATTSMIYSGAVDAAVGTVVNGVVSSVASTYEMQEELDVTLFSLQQEVMKIQCAINAARQRRITDRQLLEWLATLINLVYLGNYYHRTFKRQNSRSLKIASEGASNLVVSPSYHVSKRRRTVKTLIFGDDEIRELYNMLKKLKSIDVSTFMLMVNDQPEWSIRTYLYMDHNRLVNRDKEREQVMNFLLGPSMTAENNVDILPIVGSRGGGRNSLARHCFLDPKVQCHFSIKLCDICSRENDEDYNFRSILACMLTGCDTGEDENTLMAMVKQKFSSERFLLIMDAGWCHIGYRAWNAILNCLRCGKRGSKVILIFEFDQYNVFKKILSPGEVKPVIVDGFSDDEYMSFFQEHAFGGVDSEEYPELIEIGKEIAKELGGSLWGAKIFGELLRDNLNAEFWSYFLRDGLLSSQINWSQGSNLCAVARVIIQLLFKRSPAEDMSVCSTGFPLDVESYRELMVLGPNHLERDQLSCPLYIFLTKHVYLNRCRYIFIDFS